MLNRESIYSILSISFKMLSGPLAILLITTKLSPMEQGVYYTFISLSAIQWIFELGISTCMIQYISSNEDNIVRYRYISFLAIFLFLSSIILLLVFSILPYYIFNEIEPCLWKLPWLLYSLVVALNLFFNILNIIDESTGSIEHAYFSKMLSGVFYSICLMLSLYMGVSLYSLVIAQFAMLCITLTRQRKYMVILVSIRFKGLLDNFIKTLKEVFDFQYKLSIIWIIGYFYWNSFQLIFFKYISPEFAGFFGASNGVLGAFAMISISLISTQRAKWSKLNHNKEYLYTFGLFKKEFIKGNLIYLLLSVSLLFYFYLFPGFEINKRFLSVDLLFLLIVFRFFILIQEFFLVYLRTFKDEPLYKYTIINYILLPIVILAGVGTLDVSYILILSILIQIVFSLVYLKMMTIYVGKRIENA